MPLPFGASAPDTTAAEQQDQRSERLSGLRLLVAYDNATAEPVDTVEATFEAAHDALSREVAAVSS